MVHAVAVCLSSYECFWEVGRTLEKLEKHSASPCTTQTLLSLSPNFPRASIPYLERRTLSKDHFFNWLILFWCLMLTFCYITSVSQYAYNEVITNPPVVRILHLLSKESKSCASPSCWDCVATKTSWSRPPRSEHWAYSSYTHASRRTCCL